MATVRSGTPDGDAAPVDAAASCSFTEDALFGGSLVLFQPPRGTGYRTNVDALLLAAFATARTVAPVAFDLGAGVGAVGLVLLRLGAVRRVVFVEIDPRAASLSRRNLDANAWSDRGEVVRGDVREVARSRQGEAALVVCNPPYSMPGRGRVPAAQARARSGEVGPFVEAARQVAGKRARVCFVYPAQELGMLLATLAAEGLHAKRLRFVHGRPDRPARVALVEARASRPGGLSVLAPLVERVPGGYAPELEALLAGSLPQDLRPSHSQGSAFAKSP
jgi:tRNA1Val (adenine37-N6)-methyltransferase